MDLVRPLGLAGIKCAVVGDSGNLARYSRFTRAVVDWETGDSLPALLGLLMRFGTSQAVRPVLFYQGDSELLLISRHREQLERVFRFVVPDGALVEDLVDKARFQSMAGRLELPVPASVTMQVADRSPPVLDVPFPLIVKPLTRDDRTWAHVAGGAKAVRLEAQTDLQAIWPHLREGGTNVIAQELIPGPETMVESYHVYVDDRGRIVGEFTGRKIRTYPSRTAIVLRLNSLIDLIS
jgi:predicted ATP-grasp superfamily ATP-dependent carboligase